VAVTLFREIDPEKTSWFRGVIFTAAHKNKKQKKYLQETHKD